MMIFRVKPTYLNLRAAPSQNAPILNTLPASALAFSFGEMAQGWRKVATAQGTGWVYDDFLQPEPSGCAPWLAVAVKELVAAPREIAGKGANRRIVDYLKATDIGAPAQSDETPWCSAFVNWCLRETKTDRTRKASARSWLSWGVEQRVPRLGAIAVFKRGAPPSGHVGFYLGQEGGYVKLLGGNQRDTVSISNQNKANLISIRDLY